MIHARAPMRLSLAGGGSDLPAFCREEPGAVLAVGLQAYMHVCVNPKFDGAVRVSYSRTENVPTCADVKHDIAREALAAADIRAGVEVVSVADVPAGTGLGSSSAYAVALVSALAAYHHAGMECSQHEAARRACHLEIVRCGHPIGRQDQYMAALGGLKYLVFEGDDVTVSSVKYRPVVLDALRRRLMLLYLGAARNGDASVILRAQQDGLSEAKREATRGLVRLAGAMRDAIEGEQTQDFGAMLHESWMLKRELAPGITSPLVDSVYSAALAAGATGGKLCGAGGSGFLLLDAPEDAHTRILARLGLRPLAVRFDLEGVRVSRW